MSKDSLRGGTPPFLGSSNQLVPLGISERTFIATHVLQGILAHPGIEMSNKVSDKKLFCQMAVGFADHMLEVLNESV